MKTKEEKRKEAVERKAISNATSITERIAKLDKGNFTAKWEREKLAKLSIKESEGRIAKVTIPGPDGTPKKTPYQKPKRS